MNNQFLSAINTCLHPENWAVHARPPASTEQITKLETLLHRELPPDLRFFYLTYGGLGRTKLTSIPIESAIPDEHPGCYGPTIIPSPTQLLQNLQAQQRYMRLDSMGIVDWLRYQWDNDRPEFDEEAPDVLAQLDDQYLGFGFRRFGLDSARHIYMDRQGRCGLVDYHQDNYADLWDLYLRPMLKSSPAKMDIQDALEALLTNHESPAEF
jgi:hypothetical protein